MFSNKDLVNIDASHYSGSAFTSTVDPRSVNVNALPAPGSNVQSAASYIPCQNGGRKIHRKKINKISKNAIYFSSVRIIDNKNNFAKHLANKLFILLNIALLLKNFFY
jgi:hypothetical protein